MVAISNFEFPENCPTNFHQGWAEQEQSLNYYVDRGPPEGWVALEKGRRCQAHNFSLGFFFPSFFPMKNKGIRLQRGKQNRKT